MASSLFLAQLIGPVAVVAAVGLLVDREGYRAMAALFLASPALIFLSGLLTMTAGLAIVLSHNIWTGDWRLLVTVLGWVATLGGAARILMPGKVASLGASMMAQPIVATAGGLIWLATGLLLCFFGYVG